MTEEEIVNTVIGKVEECYETEQTKLHKLSMIAKTEGEIREADAVCLLARRSTNV